MLWGKIKRLVAARNRTPGLWKILAGILVFLWKLLADAFLWRCQAGVSLPTPGWYMLDSVVSFRSLVLEISGWCTFKLWSCLWLSYNNQTTTSSHNLYVLHIQVVLESSSLHKSVYAPSELRGWKENSFKQERTHAEWFSHSKCSDHLASHQQLRDLDIMKQNRGKSTSQVA